MFHQIEGLAVDENITFGDLKGVLTVVFSQDSSVKIEKYGSDRDFFLLPSQVRR